MNLKKLFLTLTLLVLVGTTAFAQTTWYVNNQIGNDGRNGFSATIPSPDDGITGPKKTIGGAQGAVAESNAGDIIVVANTGVQYAAATGDAAFTLTKLLTFQSTGGTVDVGVLVTVNNANAAPNNVEIFNSGAFQLSGGLTLTAGLITNASSLITVSGTITRSASAAKVNGQLLYVAPVDFSYGALMTTADEFVPSGGTFRSLTTTAGVLTIKAGTNFTMTGVLTTVAALNLGGGVATISGTNAHTVGGNVTNGTLAFSMVGGNASVAGAFTLPTITATGTVAIRTLDINGPTATGSITVSNFASVTSSGNTLVTIGSAGFTGDALVLSGIGTVVPGTGLTTINGNVLLNTAMSTSGLAGGATITFGAAATINGNVTNNASLTVTNAATWAAMTGGRIVFGNQAYTITGNLVNSTSIGGAAGTTLNVSGFGLITLGNIATAFTVNGAINNSSNTTLSSSSNPAAFTGNGLITWGNNITTGIIRADGGINNSSNYAGLTGAANTANGQIIIGGAARTGASTIGTAVNRVGALTNSSVSPTAGDGNGNITFTSDNTSSGFFGTSVTVSGSGVGGYTVFANEPFDASGTITNSRTNANVTLAVGTAGTAAMGVTVGGNIVNSGTGTTSFVVSTTGNVAVTGSVNSSAAGTITWPNLTTGTFTIGGLTVSAGTVTVPVTHTVTITVNGNVSLSGTAAVNLLSSGGVPSITMTGNSVSFTGGTLTTTGVTTLTLNSSSITFGGATTNTTFATAGTAVIVGNPTPTSLTTVTIGTFNPTIAGAFTVATNNGLAQAVNFTGGTMTVTGVLTFATSGTSSLVNISNQANITVVGNFVNTTGYTTSEQGRVTIGGAGGQTFGGAGTFGTIEFKNAAGPATSSAVTLTGFIYLTTGAVSNAGGAISINNATTFPTIVRNAGSFTAAPTFVTMVNVSYIGDDKATGNELPAAANKLNNLTVATTTGVSGARNTPSRGAVVISTTTVNGTLLVNAGQALIIGNAQTLSIKGATVTVNGDIANNGTGVLSLERTTGTTISGSGYLPPITIAATSLNNVISGPIAMVQQFFGADNEIDPAVLVNDFDPTTTSASGNLAFGAGAASLTLTLSGVAFDGTGLNNITTADPSNELVLGGDLIATGNFAHTAGTINLGGFMLTHLGTAPNITGGALVTNGTLVFGDDATTGATLLSLVTSDVTIDANVVVDLGAAATTFTLDPANAGNLILAGTFTVTKGNVVLGNGVTAINLTVTGSSVTLTANGTIDVTPTGIGTFRLNATTAPLTLTYTGTPTISRLRISNDVNLAGTGTALTVSNAFTHDGGVLNFGTRNLTFNAFTRTAGTYSATTGYMIFNGAVAVSQGASGFSIPNLRLTGATGGSLTAGAGAGTITVTGKMDFAANVGGTFTTNGKLAIADGVTVNYTSATLSAAPAYAGSITLVGLNYANPTGIPAVIWPTTAGLVTTFTVNGAAAADVLNLPGSRSVATTLNLTRGVLGLGGNTLTLASGLTINRTNLSSVTVGAGGFAFPSDNTINVNYFANAGGIGTGIELPATLNNLTVSRNANGANQITTVNSTVTINGTLSIMNDFTIPVAPPVVIVTANGNVTIVNNSATYALATNPVITNNQSLVLGGATGNQTVTVPAATPALNIGAITINKNSGNVLIAGGNLGTGTVTFTKGNIVTGTFILFLPAPTTAAVAGGATSQGFTGASFASHVVGNVGKILINTGGIGASTESRSIFPVGTGVVYRPVAITFNPAFGVPTNPNTTIVASHIDSNPGGSQALPITDGVAAGIDVSRYPAFYWNIYSTPNSVGPTTPFDLELTAGNFTDYDSPTNVRIIRRHGAVGDINNDWLLQGTNSAYDNEVSSVTGFTAINRGANAGLRSGGAVFTLGVKSNISVKTAIPKQWLVISAGTKNYLLTNVFKGNIGQLSYKAQSSNPAVATVVSPVVGATLAVTPVTIGDCIITITASDAANNDFFAYSFAVNVGLVDVEDNALPTEFALYQNFPNPFNPTTNIKFALPKESNVTLKIYNVLGQEVETLVNKVMPAGYHTVDFNATKLSSSMYIYRIEADNFVQVKKMLLMK